jgi:hypothetical protein
MEIFFPSPSAAKFTRNSFFIRRSTKPEKNLELQDIEIKVDKFRDVLQSISKKAPPPNSMFGQDRDVVREKRLKKIHEFMLGQAMVDLAKELPVGLLSEILSNCGE